MSPPRMPLVFEPLQGAARDQELARLEQLPRRLPTMTNLLGAPLEIPDAVSFLWTLPDVVERGVYHFSADSDRPRIVDGGANVGLASLFFKGLYPHSRITAFEPDPEIFRMLERNLRTWGWSDIELVQAALWSHDGELDFLGNGADGGRVVTPDEPSSGRVRAVRLRDRLDDQGTPLDLLKLDVEGAELELLRDCADRLASVRHLAVEYHSFADRPQELHELLEILTRAGFRLTIEAESRGRHPLLAPRISNDKDGYVQVFARRTA